MSTANAKPKGIKGAAKLQHKVLSRHRARKGGRCPACGRRLQRGVTDVHYGCGWVAGRIHMYPAQRKFMETKPEVAMWIGGQP